MSEEEKLVLNQKSTKVDFMTQVRIMWSNKLFKMTTIASVCLLISNDQVHRMLEIIHYEIFNQPRNIELNKPLYRVCISAGVLTFGCALFSTLSLRFGYKLAIYQFFLSKKQLCLTLV
jgi:hypothetical protein